MAACTAVIRGHPSRRIACAMLLRMRSGGVSRQDSNFGNAVLGRRGSLAPVLQGESIAVAPQHDLALVEGLQRRAMADRYDGGGRQPLLDQAIERRLRGLVERGGGFIQEQILRL